MGIVTKCGKYHWNKILCSTIALSNGLDLFGGEEVIKVDKAGILARDFWGSECAHVVRLRCLERAKKTMSGRWNSICEVLKHIWESEECQGGESVLLILVFGPMESHLGDIIWADMTWLDLHFAEITVVTVWRKDWGRASENDGKTN